MLRLTGLKEGNQYGDEPAKVQFEDFGVRADHILAVRQASYYSEYEEDPHYEQRGRSIFMDRSPRWMAKDKKSCLEIDYKTSGYEESIITVKVIGDFNKLFEEINAEDS